MLAVFRKDDHFQDTVATAMTEKLETVGADQPVEALLPIFRAGRVAIVVEQDRFLGLITRIDLLNHLRQRMK